MTIFFRYILKVSLVLSIGVAVTNATLIQNNYGLSNTHRTITFDEHALPIGTVLTNQYSDLGVIFNGITYYSPYGDVLAPMVEGSSISDFMPSRPAYPFSMSFNQDQTGVAFNLLTADPATTTFYALLNNHVVETDVITTHSASDNYYGFKDITFDQIAIHTTYANGLEGYWGNGPIIINNLQMETSASVPEPGILSLLIMGCTGLIALRRKKK